MLEKEAAVIGHQANRRVGPGGDQDQVMALGPGLGEGFLERELSDRSAPFIRPRPGLRAAQRVKEPADGCQIRGQSGPGRSLDPQRVEAAAARCSGMDQMQEVRTERREQHGRQPNGPPAGEQEQSQSRVNFQGQNCPQL